MEKEKVTMSQLVNRIKHQEEIIAQLIKMVAATNQRITYYLQKDPTEKKSKTIQ